MPHNTDVGSVHASSLTRAHTCTWLVMYMSAGWFLHSPGTRLHTQKCPERAVLHGGHNCIRHRFVWFWAPLDLAAGPRGVCRIGCSWDTWNLICISSSSNLMMSSKTRMVDDSVYNNWCIVFIICIMYFFVHHTVSMDSYYRFRSPTL